MYHLVIRKPSLRVGLLMGLLIGLSLLLLTACGGQGGQAEKGDKAAAVANKQIDNPIVGTWRRTRNCDDYVSELRQAGLADQIPSHQELVGEFGADNTQSGQDPDDPCAGIKEDRVAHDNVFYKDGQFAAVDENGEFADEGHYKLSNDHTIVFPPPSDPSDPWSQGPAVTSHFRFRNDHNTVKFDVVLPDKLDECSPLCRNVYWWGVIATYGARPWNQVAPEDLWPGEAS
jgi:hypothetical protein